MSQSKGVLKYEMVSEFMRGRYGVDQLSFALLILYFVITILGTAFRIPYIGYVALLLIVWCWFRILSRNTYKRSQENANLWGGSTDSE